ncbi:hypothetical protein ZWY2020_012051 [Hordeum vulgare]|nr:hypothetical protein ZWY2020_012051 [Hordeum vulgare]
MLYTGIDANNVQVHNVAFSKNPADPLLREWVKPAYNPIIPHPADVPDVNFRDPSTPWPPPPPKSSCLAPRVVGGNKGIGSTLIYRSKDFRRWKQNALSLYAPHVINMVECPDLFPMTESGMEEGRFNYTGNTASDAVRHVLKLSTTRTTTRSGVRRHKRTPSSRKWAAKVASGCS